MLFHFYNSVYFCFQYVKPGDPPFPGAGEIHVEEYKTKEPKKQTPAMSLLKRSVYFLLF